MAESQSNAYKNERRQKTKIITREALFVHEYVKTKYEDIYNEAAAFYNEINKMHARKPDLRKSLEFRVWKNKIAAAKGQPQTYIPRPKEHYYNRTQYTDITIVPPTKKPKEKRVLNNLLTANLNIPLIPQHIATKGIVNDQATEPPAVDTVPTRTADSAITDEIANDDLLIDPSITDELMPETVAQIIRDLQADPSIKDLMDGIENTLGIQNTEEEIPELQIDLPEPTDYLEEEMMWW